MSDLNGIIQAVDDRINPIVVRELRQAVAGRFVMAVLLLFLIVMLFALGIFLLSYDGAARDMEAGLTVFAILRGVVLFVGMLAIPAYAGLRLGAERSDTHADLLFVTTLRPRAIIWGKFLAALVIAVLIYSACTPFLSLTYLLRGIDLPTIALALALDMLVVAASIMFAVFLACIPATRLLRVLLFLAGFIGLVIAFFTYIIWIALRLLQAGIGSLLSGLDPWIAMAAWVLGFALAIGLMHVLCVAMISPPSTNRALPVRGYLMGMWTVLGAAMFGWSAYAGDYGPVAVWLVVEVWLLSAVLLGAASEREHIGPRIANSIPRGTPGRLAAFLLYSGAAGGLLWTMMMLAATLGGARLWVALHEGPIPVIPPMGSPAAMRGAADMLDLLGAHAQLALYAVAYVLTAVALRRTALRRLITPVNTYALAMILMGLGSVLPFVLALVIGNSPWHRLESTAFITVPFMVMADNVRDEPIYWWFPGGWAAIALLLNLPWMLDRLREFRRPPAAGERPTPMSYEPATDPAVVQDG